MNADDKRNVQVSFNSDSNATWREVNGFQAIDFEPSDRAGTKALDHLTDLKAVAVQKKPESRGAFLEFRRTHTDQFDGSLRIPSARVAFVRDRNSQELYIQVIDRATGEVLREIPPAELRRLAAALEETFGHLLDSFA